MAQQISQKFLTSKYKPEAMINNITLRYCVKLCLYSVRGCMNYSYDYTVHPFSPLRLLLPTIHPLLPTIYIHCYYYIYIHCYDYYLSIVAIPLLSIHCCYITTIYPLLLYYYYQSIVAILLLSIHCYYSTTIYPLLL